jgi:hypothetical protein
MNTRADVADLIDCQEYVACVQSWGCAKVVRRISSTGFILVLSIETLTLLENERGKRFNFVAILQVFLAEALHHKTLFSPGLQPKRKSAN